MGADSPLRQQLKIAIDWMDPTISIRIRHRCNCCNSGVIISIPAKECIAEKA